MHEPIEFTNEALQQWGAEQLLYAGAISENDDRHSLAAMLIESCSELETKLFWLSPELALQQDKFLAENLAKQGMDKAGSMAPVEHSSQAYRDTHPDIIALVTTMVELRAQAETLQKGQGS